jgi:hypothetical protein
MDWITISFYAVGAVAAAVYGTEDLARYYAMRRLARKLGFSYLRRTLPGALSLYGTPFAQMWSTWNVLDKQEKGRNHIVVFDCQVGEKQSSWRSTVIAARTGSTTLPQELFGESMRVQNSGGWSIAYYPQEAKRGLMPLKELRGHLTRSEDAWRAPPDPGAIRG